MTKITITDKAAEKRKILDAAIAKIKKDQGLEFRRLGDRVGEIYPCIPTGIFAVDHEVLGIGGFPQGRIVEVLGPEASGKTSIALHTVAEAQRMGMEAAFIDAEHALSPTYASALGVDVDNLLVAQPDHGEQALQAAVDLVDSHAVGIIVVDSVASLVPKAELDAEVSDAQVGLQARLMGKAMRMLAGRCNTSGTLLLMINQIREKVGVTFGSNETSPGGRALRFYASVRLDVRRLAQVKDGDVNAGNKTRVKGAKNKMSPPFREVDCELLFGKGFDDVMSLTTMAVEHGVWKQNGKNYVFSETGELLVGKSAVCDELRANQHLYDQTFVATLKAMGKSSDYIEAAVKRG